MMNRLKRFLKWLLFLLFIWALIRLLFGEGAVIQQRILSNHNDQLRHTNDSLSFEIDLLKKRIDQLQNDSLILESIARTQFGMSKEGEMVYRFVPAVESKEKSRPAQ